MIETPSPNFDERKLPVSMLVLHYTGMPDAESAIRWLANPESKVSAHYVVTERRTLLLARRERCEFGQHRHRDRQSGP